MQIDFFKQTIVRTTSLSYEHYEKNATNLLDFCENNIFFKMSILLSSRILYDEIAKGKIENTSTSLNSYLSRAHFNPVPFGTFSGIGVVSWNDKTKLRLNPSLILVVEHDNLFITNYFLEDISESSNDIKYYSNPSVHILGESKIGYYKSEKLKDGNYKTKYADLDFDETAKWVTDFFKKGISLWEARNYLSTEGFENSDINDFFDSLTTSGLILSEIAHYPYRQPSKKIDFEYSSLVKTGVHRLSSTEDCKNFMNAYKAEQNNFNHSVYEQKKYLHSIASFRDIKGGVGNDIKNKIKDFLYFTLLKNSNYKPINQSLKKFGERFYHRYQDRFVPIGKVFNPYSGFEYETSFENKLTFPPDIVSKILISDKDDVVLPKVRKLNEVKAKIKEFPTTFSIVYELLTCKVTNKNVVYMKGVNGASAIPLVARFDYHSNDLCKEIASFEQNSQRNEAIAEVNLFSKPRAINLVAQQQYFDYHIPINTIPIDDSSPLTISDLFLRYDSTGFALISKKLGKLVTPRITSAINVSLSDSSIYQFLADLQYQNKEVYALSLNMNFYRNTYLKYVPRIYLGGDILLSPAQILITTSGMNLDEFKDYLNNLLSEYSFSGKISYFDGQRGEIVLDTKNNQNIQKLYDVLKHVHQMYISEVLYESFDSMIVDGKNLGYCHELVSSVKINSDITNSRPKIHISEDMFLVEEFSPIVSDWLYLEVFSNSYAENDILIQLYESILMDDSKMLFFFVRYDYPQNHLRLRFKVKTEIQKNKIVQLLSQMKSNSLLSTYRILPYEPEIHRYGGVDLIRMSEEIFGLDSHDTLKNLIAINSSENETYVFAIGKIYSYLQLFSFSHMEMVEFCKINISSFSNERILTVKEKKELSRLYKILKNDLFGSNFLESNFTMIIDRYKDLNSKIKDKYGYLSDIIHMSMNRIFDSEQRLHELKSYHLTKKYIDQLIHMPV